MTDALTRMELVLHLRRRGITDVRVLNAFERVPREMFVSADFADNAYGDTALPIACGQTISQPFIVAYMTEKLGPDSSRAVLEIGTGSGYQTAILAHVFREVFTLEYHEPLLRAAEARFKALGLTNITALLGDGWQGWPDGGECERIIVTAAAPEVPAPLFAQLAEGGRMIIPLESEDGQFLTEVFKEGGKARHTRLLPVQFVPLLRASPSST
ncbi:protein-L-isoaspartate(D-aspartate) O-methyltransferase [Dichotomicrobium thermohalophilum]|uniref:Protein-L-isoaspartate O-methyltransferase n=1 Tax=Dichotomicrobium thermohalophilum TaxID=933063 RepID=A0A397Q3E5_9HYPH|nr:protein-L-isoaspartate(D-aspartate) O-methyltransferase [Dichotomicrobium thermohalophilum]RIA55652.1 protein-L-isoaspartate(D-aspartate) O-methyltransferase [Dichotomicrobium thermohalophilum]